MDPVTSHKCDLLIGAGRFVAGLPVEGVRPGIKTRTGRQIVGPIHQRISVRIRRRDRKLEPLTFTAFHGLGKDPHDGSPITTGHGDHVLLGGIAAARVVDTQCHGGLVRALSSRVPLDQAGKGVYLHTHRGFV